MSKKNIRIHLVSIKILQFSSIFQQKNPSIDPLGPLDPPHSFPTGRGYALSCEGYGSASRVEQLSAAQAGIAQVINGKI